MPEYMIECGCGAKLQVYAEAPCQIFCVLCQKRIFPFYNMDKNDKTNVLDQKGGHQSLDEQQNEKFVNYSIMDELGEGGFAKVFLATNNQNQEKVAIKLLLFDSFTDEERETFINYFMREAEILSQLEHPNIVEIKDSGHFNGNPYLVMEYIEGPTVFELIQNKQLSISKAVNIAYKICSALDYSYCKYNLIHRDIKPSNIILDAKANNNPKLIDFG